MTLHTKLGTYQEVFDTSNPLVQNLAKCIADFIIEFDKDVDIVFRTGEKTVAYGIGPKKMSQAYCYIMPQNDYLNLGFFHGSELLDPTMVLEGTGKKLRHVKIRSIAQAQSQDIMDLIIEARKNRIAATSK
jgi:Domain of unknown function (DU1801)